IGDARFMPPERFIPESDPIDATRFGNRNFQVQAPEVVYGDVELPGEESEDCLFLNIYAPENFDEPKPVLVWIHGGAFMCGSGNEYDPSRIVLENNIVVVTINYRLGIFGFPNLQRFGPEFIGSANLGIQDQIAALRWVNQNISSFGGDTENVTIWGESAGAGSVLALLGCPAAEGLFHKGMVFSGGETLHPPLDQLELIKAHLGIVDDAECLRQLKSLPAAELSQIQEDLLFYVGPSVDGIVITQPACEAIRNSPSASIPILAGATRDEGTLLAPLFNINDEAALGMVFALSMSVGRDDGMAYQAYLNEKFAPQELEQRIGQAWFDTFRASALRVAMTASEYGAGGWIYNFEVETDNPLGITHFSDVPFTFNWIEENHPWLFVHPASDENRQLAEKWSRTVIEFARTGSPNGHGLPEWPKYDRHGHQCMRISHQSEIVANPDGEMLQIYRVS
ncbi:MAG: carboxylesterase family protein, partial [Gammaproteobacteria bacterium]|nr:carboxylesterase family protein [Gammaproteobacteria bacterium]